MASSSDFFVLATPVFNHCKILIFSNDLEGAIPLRSFFLFYVPLFFAAKGYYATIICFFQKQFVLQLSVSYFSTSSLQNTVERI